MWASIWSREVRYVRSLFTEIMGDSWHYSLIFMQVIRIFSSTLKVDWSDTNYIDSSQYVHYMDDTSIMVMAVIAVATMVLHTVFSWLFMLKLGCGAG